MIPRTYYFHLWLLTNTKAAKWRHLVFAGRPGIEPSRASTKSVD